MMNSVLNSGLHNEIQKQISIKEKQFNCIITLYMEDGNDKAGCDMQVVFLNSASLGPRKHISNTAAVADVATGIIKYFK